MAELEFRALTKVYGAGSEALLAVDDFDLTVADGETVGLLGSSGCGKTTSLRSVAGFVDPTSGSILLDGAEIQHLPPARRQVTMAFEGYALYPPLRVRENIAFALLRDQQDDQQALQAVNDIAATLEIDDILDEFPAVISAGQQQRTSLARALVRKAPVTLLDEPMSQLEPRLRTLLRARVKDFLTRHRLTTIFVTHDQNEAITLADRIAVMEQGRLMQCGTATELRDRPANLFVAEFIGEPPMNIIDAQSIDENGRRALRLLRNGDEVGRIGADAIDKPKIKLGIRPHRLVLGESGQLRGTVVSNQWLGDQGHILLDVAGLRLVAVVEAKRPDWGTGAELGVSMPVEALHFFDVDTGVALRG